MRDYTTGTVLKGDARTIRSVARQIGRSYGGTRVLLVEAGVQLRARGGRVRKAAV